MEGKSNRFDGNAPIHTLGWVLRTELGASLVEALEECVLEGMGDLRGSPVRRETEDGGSEGALDLAGVFKGSDMLVSVYSDDSCA